MNCYDHSDEYNCGTHCVYIALAQFCATRNSLLSALPVCHSSRGFGLLVFAVMIPVIRWVRDPRVPRTDAYAALRFEAPPKATRLFAAAVNNRLGSGEPLLEAP